MAHVLRISPRAARDLDRAEERFFQYAGPTPEALQRYEALLTAVWDLRQTPTTWPWSRFEGVRERVVSGCKIYYRVTSEIGDNAAAGEVRALHLRLPGQDDPAAL